MTRPLTVQEVARYILARQGASVEPITNKRLQKLVYLAQGRTLALLHRPLWDTSNLGARLTAWEQGPVVPELYREYRSHRWNPLPIPSDVDIEGFDPTARAIIDSVLAEFGGMSTDQLATLTHTHDPWVNAWAKVKDATSKPVGYDVIPEPQIESYFTRLLTGPVDPRALSPEALSAAVHAQPTYAVDHARSTAQIKTGQGMRLGELRRFLGL
jgi:uncharacterized phage-associated protein